MTTTGVAALMADPATLADRLRGAAIDRLLDDAGASGWSRLHPYRKWAGAHWRLVSLVELGERDDPRCLAMLDRVLGWLGGQRRLRGVPVIDGRPRRCASQEGNAVFVAARLSHAAAASALAEHLVGWQWPDGGWNCDRRVPVTHASFHETVWPLRGLAAYHDATGDPAALEAARRAAVFLLRHRLYRSERSGAVIDPEWLHLHWPPTWRYDVLQGLRAVAAVGWAGKPEAAEALDWLRDRRRDDGTWATSGRRWWKPPGSDGGGVEVVDWGPLGDQLVTAQAAAVLAAARGVSGVADGVDKPVA